MVFKFNLAIGGWDISPGFYTKGRPLVKLSWQPGCPILNINIEGNFCIGQGNGSSDNPPENLA